MVNRVYIAGPMRGHKFYNFPAFDKHKALLRSEGLDVVSPADIDRTNGFDPTLLPAHHNWARWPEGIAAPLKSIVIRDLCELATCTTIYMMGGWENSIGAKAELAVARWLRLHVRYAVLGEQMLFDFFKEDIL
jgi:hypothetical protein